MKALALIGVAAVAVSFLSMSFIPDDVTPEQERILFDKGWDAAKVEITERNRTAYNAARKADEALAMCRGRGGDWITGKGCDR